MKRWWCMMALAPVLSGCSILYSEQPLIANSDPAAAIATGRYQVYLRLATAGLSQEQRRSCLDFGYRAEPGSPEGRDAMLLHCPFGETGGAIPPLQIVAEKDGFRVLSEAPDEKPFGLRLVPLTSGLRLFQHIDQEWPQNVKVVYYGLLRRRGDDLEALLVPCHDDNPPKLLRPPAVPEPKPELDCLVVSIDAIRPALIAYGGRADAAPGTILRRIGD